MWRTFPVGAPASLVLYDLAGLAVDVLTTALLFVTAHVFAGSVLIMSVCWRLAILSLLNIVENLLPILEVDGHVALADYLDEPDLAPRSREALSRKLRGIRHNEQPGWLTAYGAVSLIGGKFCSRPAHGYGGRPPQV